MRADATFRIILNARIGFGSKPDLLQDRYVKFTGLEDGRPKQFNVRVR
jgi:hypothetical protein